MSDDGNFFTGLFTIFFVLLYWGVGLLFFWWSIKVTIWFFTGGDFPLPWQPFG